MTMDGVSDFGNPISRYALAKWLAVHCWRAHRALCDRDSGTSEERKEAFTKAFESIYAAAAELWDNVYQEGLPEFEQEIHRQEKAKLN